MLSEERRRLPPFQNAGGVHYGQYFKTYRRLLAPIACLEDEPNLCERASVCKTLSMWQGFYKLINEYFDRITLEDLLREGEDGGNYVI